MEINYTLGINDSIDRTKPWHLTGCSTGKNKEDFFNSSLHYPVYVHSNTWTKFESAKDDASRALDCYATIPGKYFDNKVQCTIEGDLNYVLAMVNGYTIQTGSQCHDNKSNYGQPKDCSYDYCTGIPYWSCPDSTNISKYYENHISLEGYDYPYKDPCDVDANICWGTLDLGGGYTVDFTYTKTAQPNGRFKVKFDHGNVNTNNYVTNYITNTLPPFDDYGQYDIDDKYPSYGSGIGLPDNETASGVYKTYFDGEDGSLQGNLNHIMWVNFSNAEQKTHGLELISVYEGYQNTPEKVYATVDTNAPGNLNESDSALYHNISFIQGTQTSDHACNDGFDNDLDYGTDCKDSDCVGVKIGETLGGDGIKCESTETTCWDGFDNDDNGLVDCEDPACQDKIGAYLDNSGIPIKYDTGNTEVKCENLEGGNYYSSTPSSCNDNFDNDADNQAWGAGISCNGTYSDCRGTNIDCFDPYNCWGRGGLSGTCPFRETNCNDNFDNDYDADIVGTSGNWQGLFIPDSSPEEDLGGYDCDDYDCSGSSNCASDETLLPNGTQNLSQCFDGIDNDLDKYYWNESKGEYVRNTSTGIDCSDPSCLGVTNPDNSLEGCYEREFYLGYYDLARNGRDDDHDLDAGFNERNVADCSDNQFSRDNYSKRATNVNDLQYTDAWAKYQVCGPCPAIENYTYDSCADNFDNDYDDGEGGYAPYGGGEDCSDSDCLNELATYSGTRCVETGYENTPKYSLFLCL